MPEESKKNQHKGKHEAKDQRKPRQPRQHAAEKSEKKNEKKTEEPRVPPATKPVYEDPGPEFYQNLKRETDEILKITEEANAKYKKKEIKSNWTKYEMPIESYDEIEEHENMGADYEKLIQAPLSLGGHFQFKHEKSWDVDSAPSLYDKYFEINMENLATAINTAPFFERNHIDLNIFSKTDVLSMNNRAVRYKRKYYNDKSYTTSELEAQDSILDNLRKVNEANEVTEDSPDIKSVLELPDTEFKNNSKSPDRDISLENFDTEVTSPSEPEETELLSEDFATLEKSVHSIKLDENIDIDNLILGSTTTQTVVADADKQKLNQDTPQTATIKAADTKPVLETPEDLEKWLDDFLDG